MRYVALLRGINVGGNKKVPMYRLKTAFEQLGFSSVKTLLASGNVVFEGESANAEAISAHLEREFGFPIPTICLPFSEIAKIAASGAFKAIPVTSQTRLYVTFSGGMPISRLKLPYSSPDGSFRILRLADTAIFSVLDISKTGTPDAMAILEKEFGKNITTRNLNTVQKIAAV